MKEIIAITLPSVITGILVVLQLLYFEGGWFDITTLTLSGVCFGGCVGLGIVTHDLARQRRKMQKRFDDVDKDIERFKQGTSWR